MTPQLHLFEFNKTTVQPDIPSLLLLSITDIRGEKSQENCLERIQLILPRYATGLTTTSQRQEFLEGDFRKLLLLPNKNYFLACYMDIIVNYKK